MILVYYISIIAAINAAIIIIPIVKYKTAISNTGLLNVLIRLIY